MRNQAQMSSGIHYLSLKSQKKRKKKRTSSECAPERNHGIYHGEIKLWWELHGGRKGMELCKARLESMRKCSRWRWDHGAWRSGGWEGDWDFHERASLLTRDECFHRRKPLARRERARREGDKRRWNCETTHFDKNYYILVLHVSPWMIAKLFSTPKHG